MVEPAVAVLILVLVSFLVVELAILTTPRHHRKKKKSFNVNLQPQPKQEYLAPEPVGQGFEEKTASIVEYAVGKLYGFYPMPESGRVEVEVVPHHQLHGAIGACGLKGDTPVVVLSELLNTDLPEMPREIVAFREQTIRPEGTRARSATDVLIRVLLEEVCHAFQISEGRTDTYQGPINQFTYAAYANSPMESEAKQFAQRWFMECKVQLQVRRNS